MRVLLFGMFAEMAGTSSMDVQAASIHELKAALMVRIPGLDQLCHALAVDRRIVRDDMPLTGAEEIALLPPFAGG